MYLATLQGFTASGTTKRAAVQSLFFAYSRVDGRHTYGSFKRLAGMSGSLVRRLVPGLQVSDCPADLIADVLEES